jgi:transcription-repair coupling factor (superfamily II helicase)
VREVGIELYQNMLEEAVAALRSGDKALEIEGEWSPQISLGAAVLIPEGYVPDLNVRMSLYRRLSELGGREDIDGFAAELIDRFGPLPDEVRHLLEVVAIKQLCRAAGVEKIDAGPKGATISFRNNAFANPKGLVEYIGKQAGSMKVRPDQTVVYMRDWPTPEDRLKGAHLLLSRLADLAAAP